MVLLDHEKVKGKDISSGENLYEVPEGGRIETLPLKSYQERSPMWVEVTIQTNFGIEEDLHII